MPIGIKIAKFPPVRRGQQGKARDSPAKIPYPNCDIPARRLDVESTHQRDSKPRKTKIQLERKLFFREISTFLSFFAGWRAQANSGFWRVLSADRFCGFGNFGEVQKPSETA